LFVKAYIILLYREVGRGTVVQQEQERTTIEDRENIPNYHI
jgi:hypothetical protein